MHQLGAQEEDARGEEDPQEEDDECRKRSVHIAELVDLHHDVIGEYMLRSLEEHGRKQGSGKGMARPHPGVGQHHIETRSDYEHEEGRQNDPYGHGHHIPIPESGEKPGQWTDERDERGRAEGDHDKDDEHVDDEQGEHKRREKRTLPVGAEYGVDRALQGIKEL